METHYVCPDCGGVADHAKVCETPGCTREGHDLIECNCADGNHMGAEEPAVEPMVPPAEM